MICEHGEFHLEFNVFDLNDVWKIKDIVWLVNVFLYFAWDLEGCSGITASLIMRKKYCFNSLSDEAQCLRICEIVDYESEVELI